MTKAARTLIKVGGSLYDWPLLGERLRALLQRHRGARVILFPGGGATADVVRAWDGIHRVGDEAAHWLALRALAANAYFLQTLLPDVPVVASPGDNDVSILEPHAFALADEANPGHLPHRWDVTSDSLAVRAAHVLGAEKLLLLKSASLKAGATWPEATRLGFVDAYFATALAATACLEIHAINLRDDTVSFSDRLPLR